jgi:hypothetical protein
MLDEALIGIIVTVIIGVLAIVYTLKYRKEIELTYLQRNCFSLFRSVADVENLDVLYEGRPIDPHLLLLKGSIINNGNNDIHSSKIEQPLKLSLPEGYALLKTDIGHLSEGVSVQAEPIGENSVAFRWDLFKKNEYFDFDALIMSPADAKEDVFTDIKFSHRITDLYKLGKKRPAPREVGATFAFIYTSILLAIWLFASFVPIHKTVGFLAKIDGTKKQYDLKVEDNKIVVKDTADDSVLVGVSPEQFFQEYKAVPTVNKGPMFFWSTIWVVGILCFLLITVILWMYFHDRRIRKLERVRHHK